MVSFYYSVTKDFSMSHGSLINREIGLSNKVGKTNETRLKVH